MEDKKMLNEEELGHVAGGAEDGYGTVVCCPRDNCHSVVPGNHYGEAYGICPKCRSKRQGVALYHNGTLEQIQEGYEFLLK